MIAYILSVRIPVFFLCVVGSLSQYIKTLKRILSMALQLIFRKNKSKLLSGTQQSRFLIFTWMKKNSCMKCDSVLVQGQRKYEDELGFIIVKIVFTFIFSLLNLDLTSWAAFHVLSELKKHQTELSKCNLLYSPLKPWASISHNCDLREQPSINPILHILVRPKVLFLSRDYINIHQYPFDLNSL